MFLFTDQPGDGADFRFTPGWLVGTLLIWTVLVSVIAAIAGLT